MEKSPRRLQRYTLENQLSNRFLGIFIYVAISLTVRQKVSLFIHSRFGPDWPRRNLVDCSVCRNLGPRVELQATGYFGVDANFGD